jgi:chemotaxis-related protein WspB
MLLLLFEVGKNRYGIEALEIVEVVPAVSLRIAPHTPGYVAGLLNYRGVVTPVVDVHILLGESRARSLLSTRIIIVRLDGPDGAERRLGLIAERVTETIACRPEDFQKSGVGADDARYLGEVLPLAQGMVQKVSVAKILPEELKRRFFDQADMVAEPKKSASPKPRKSRKQRT